MRNCPGGQPHKTKRWVIVSQTSNTRFQFLVAVSLFRRITWLVWTCRGFLGREGVERFWGFGVFLFVFCLYCGVFFCLFVFKLFSHTSYCENLTAQGTFLELWHYLAMELIRYPWHVVAVPYISGTDNSMPQFKMDFHPFPHNFVPQFYRKYARYTERTAHFTDSSFHTHSFLVWEFHVFLFLKKLWHLKGCT